MSMHFDLRRKTFNLAQIGSCEVYAGDSILTCSTNNVLVLLLVAHSARQFEVSAGLPISYFHRDPKNFCLWPPPFIAHNGPLIPAAYD
jgi:hypothetical protein